MTPYEKTLYIQRLLYQAEKAAREVDKDSVTMQGIAYFEKTAMQELDRAIDSYHELLEMCGYVPISIVEVGSLKHKHYTTRGKKQ